LKQVKEFGAVLDAYYREIRYLRLSVTDRCNYRCAYCMPPEGVNWLEPSTILTDEEIIRVLSVLGREGVSKVRLTGGEPLIRPGFVELVRKIRGLDSIEDLSMTTNGSLLARYAGELKTAGLNRVNISLDTVDPERFRTLTSGGDVLDVLAGIEAAIRVGLSPVKINVVLTAAVDEADLSFFQKLVREQPVAVRFIEYMPSRRCRVEAGMTMTSVTEYLAKLAAGKLAPLPRVLTVAAPPLSAGRNRSGLVRVHRTDFELFLRSLQPITTDGGRTVATVPVVGRRDRFAVGLAFAGKR
jgi:cyclic pyranopterin phosphate synthase